MKILSFTLIIVLSNASLNLECENDKSATTPRYEIVSGKGEIPFDRAYGLNITLPLPESKLLTLLQELKLGYESFAQRGTKINTPHPILDPEAVDFEKIQKCYKIYGRKPREAYLAFVDENNRVVYIENDFIYPAP